MTNLELADMLERLAIALRGNASPREMALERAAVEFVAKVERGEMRAGRSYAAFKHALGNQL